MPGILDANQVGKREFLMSVIFLADGRNTPFVSAANKPASSYKNEKNGIPNMLGTYQCKTLGSRKAGGVADGRDASAFDSNDPRALLAFRGEKYWRHPMVGDIAEGNDVAGIKSEYAEAVADQSIELKRDIETEMLGDQDSSANGGAEGGSTTRGMGRWVNDGTLAITDPNCPIPANLRTPSSQIFSGSIGDGMATGLTEAVAKGLLKARWDNTGDSGELMGFVGKEIQDRFSFFSSYVPNVTNTTAIIRTMREGFGTGTFLSPYVDVYKSGPYGAFTLMPVPTAWLPGANAAYRAYFLDMSQIEIRSRYWFRRHELPDLGGGPREEIACLIALIAGDPRSHVKVDGAA